jgi:hypothetical protein
MGKLSVLVLAIGPSHNSFYLFFFGHFGINFGIVSQLSLKASSPDQIKSFVLYNMHEESYKLYISRVMKPAL